MCIRDRLYTDRLFCTEGDACLSAWLRAVRIRTVHKPFVLFITTFILLTNDIKTSLHCFDSNFCAHNYSTVVRVLNTDDGRENHTSSFNVRHCILSVTCAHELAGRSARYTPENPKRCRELKNVNFNYLSMSLLWTYFIMEKFFCVYTEKSRTSAVSGIHNFSLGKSQK